MIFINHLKHLTMKIIFIQKLKWWSLFKHSFLLFLCFSFLAQKGQAYSGGGGGHYGGGHSGGEKCYVDPNDPRREAKISWTYNSGDHTYTIRTTFSKKLGDNCYDHKDFKDLVGHDYLQLALYDGSNRKKLEFKIDYISASKSVRSGYKCLGVWGGNGRMIYGHSSNIISAKTSLDANFNDYGYVMTRNSPATDENYSTNSSYPNWIYDVWYEIKVKASAFNKGGFDPDLEGYGCKKGKKWDKLKRVKCPPKCIVSSTAISNVKYYVDGKTYTPTPATYTSTLNQAVQQGKKLKICFTVAKGTGISTFTLASYKAPYATFVRSAAHLQELYDYETVDVGPEGGDVCLEVKVPDCFFQVDFVKGCVIKRLGPADTDPNNFYGRQNRLIASGEGGTVSCVPPEKIGCDGCTPGYWKQSHHFGSWAPAVPTGTNATKFFDVFDVCDASNANCKYQGLPANLTLLQALELGGGGFNALARHAAAAYLNAINTDVDYSMSSNDVVAGVINAFKTGNSGFKEKLEKANEAGCPLGKKWWWWNSANNSNDGVSEIESTIQPKMNQLSGYPNPFRDRAMIHFTLDKSENFTLNLFDIQGKLVKQLRVGIAKAGELNQVPVDGSTLTEGVYFAKLVTKSHSKTIRLILKK